MTGEALPIVTTGYVMQVLISLAVVIGLIYVLARYFLPRLKVGAPGRIIQVVDRVMLEPQVSAYIIKIGKKAWLIVSGGKNVEKISEIELE